MESFEVFSGPFRTLAPDDPRWSVMRLSGTEAMNELSSFDVEVAIRLADARARTSDVRFERALLGQSVVLGIGDDPMRRAGVVTACSRLADYDDERIAFRLAVAERPWLCTQRRNTRIFQNHLPHEIISVVLAEHGVRHRWVLGNTYVPREYCTQYEETDWEFVTRLMAEEGIFFYFAHIRGFTGGTSPAPEPRADWDADEVEEREPAIPGNGSAGPDSVGDRYVDVLVMGDQDGAHRTAVTQGGAPLTLEIAEAPGDTKERIFALRRRANVRPQALHLRDYDPRRPLLTLARDATREDAPEPREDPSAILEIYEHHGEYETPDVSEETAAVRLEQHTDDHILYTGESNSPCLIPGHTVVTDLRGSQLITRVRHAAYNSEMGARDSERDATIRACARAIAAARARHLDEHQLRAMLREAIETPPGAPLRYRNDFETRGSPAVHRPPAPKRVLRAVTETATVVGPSDEAVFVDRLGRIRVQFHWDRDGKFDGFSSCWIRVAHPWAGTGFGHQFIPRVGMEVVVTFVGGDPDRPLVIGSVYNQTHPLPEPVPEKASRSGIRTESFPGGGGFNELSFDDQKGMERVYLKAERDLVTEVGNKHALNVAGEQENQVLGDRRQVVGRHHISGVRGNEMKLIGGDAGDFVRGTRNQHVAHHNIEQVNGSSIRTVRGTDVGAFASDRVEQVAGHDGAVIGGSLVEMIGGRDEDGNAVRFVDGQIFTTAGKSMVLRVEDDRGDAPSLRLVCGESEIELLPDRIVLRSPNLELRAEEEAVMSTKRGSLLLNRGAELHGRKVLLRRSSALPDGGPGSSVLLTDTDVTIEGDKISMIKPVPAGSPRYEPETSTVEPEQIRVQLTHLEGRHVGADGTLFENLAGVDFRAVARGETCEGTIDGAGEATLLVPPGTKEILLTAYVDRHDELSKFYDRPLVWAIEVVDDVSTFDQPRGARIALRNLGYEPGTDLDLPELDDVTRAALRQFQAHRNLAVTGELDATTVEAFEKSLTGIDT